MKIDTLLKVADIAISAGLITLRYFRQGAQVGYKPDGSPVTVADIEAERFIVSALGGLFPEISAVGEESLSNEKKYDNCSPHWLIDPLDGTLEYINDREEYSVNIGFVSGGVPVAGVIHAPAMGLTYIGSISDGAYRLANNELIRLPDSSCKRPVAVISRSFANRSDNDVSENFADIDLMYMGSSLKFCMLAEGKASFYPRKGRTMHWDTAAGHAILKAAGGEVISWDTGKELSYLNETFENPSFIAFRSEWKSAVSNAIKIN